jgi:hypothetical protein
LPDPRCDSQVLHHEGYDGRVTYLGIGELAGAGMAGSVPPPRKKMTSLATWVGVDSRGTSSMYFVSDSRITWQPGGSEWNFGKKLFASRNSADVFGYCGDVLFPVLFLGQLQSLLNSSVLFTGHENPVQRHELIVRMMQSSMNSYPAEKRATFTILHGLRERSGLKSEFHLWKTEWNNENNKWSDTNLPLPNESRLAIALGSGADVTKKWVVSWQRPLGGVSRAVFGIL